MNSINGEQIVDLEFELGKFRKKYHVETSDEFYKRLAEICKSFIAPKKIGKSYDSSLTKDNRKRILPSKKVKNSASVNFLLPECSAKIFPKNKDEIDKLIGETIWQKSGELINYIKGISESEDIENRDVYAKMVESFQTSLKSYYMKTNDRYKKEKITDDECSEKFSEQLNKAVKEKIIDNLIPALYNRIKITHSSGLEKIVRHLNDFLKCCGYYTMEIKIGEKLNGIVAEYVDRLNPANPKDELMISEVMHFPYILKYYDESGDVNMHVIRGKVVIGGCKNEF